ncbi:hypothetical protein OAF87_00035 [Akkermansiaceae bacterium]|nr:hypothetical protein [Akkermansiaceae bacterium]MDB4740189.1 hypothetical protein [Akkermansiaceae bacterium]MDC1405623.1 hypothetical protein [Akkermansiaceae bacterium]
MKGGEALIILGLLAHCQLDAAVIYHYASREVAGGVSYTDTENGSLREEGFDRSSSRKSEIFQVDEKVKLVENISMLTHLALASQMSGLSPGEISFEGSSRFRNSGGVLNYLQASFRVESFTLMTLQGAMTAEGGDFYSAASLYAGDDFPTRERIWGAIGSHDSPAFFSTKIALEPDETYVLTIVVSLSNVGYGNGDTRKRYGETNTSLTATIPEPSIAGLSLIALILSVKRRCR